MKTKKVTITLTQEEQDKVRALSIKMFGRQNISGWISSKIRNSKC